MNHFLKQTLQRTLASSAITVATLLASTALQADLLDTVKQRGAVICGVNPALPGFSETNSLGEYSGLDIDFCRAIASAVFNDPEATEFVPVSASERFDALLTGRFDVLTRNTTWTLERNSLFGAFIGVNYYDGQGFMVKRKSGIRSALELDNASICVERGTTTELNAIDFFELNRMRYRPVYFSSGAETASAFEEGKCVALTTDRSGLAGQRAGFETPEAHSVLPEVISKEPLGPVVPHSEPAWENVVRWTLNCMINAEEMGISSDNVSAERTGDTPAARRLLGLEGELGSILRLDPRWCANVIQQVGNYAQSYDRHVGPDTRLALTRGVNRLWTDGGILYAPPLR